MTTPHDIQHNQQRGNHSMNTRHAVLGICVVGLLAACGGSSANEAQGLVGSTVDPASSTASSAPTSPTPSATASAPSTTPSPTATPKPTPTKAASTPAPSTTKKSTPVPVPTKTKGTQHTDPRFATCKAAKAAGYGPYYRGKDPEYSWYNDRDHDGIVCE